MQHIIWHQSEEYPIGVLIKSSAMYQNYIQHHYIEPTKLNADMFIALNLYYQPNNKVPVGKCKEWLNELLPVLTQTKTKLLLVADTNYFKVLTGVQKTEHSFGKVVPCKYKGFEDISCILTYNYQSLLHNPSNQQKMDLSVQALRAHMTGASFQLGSEVLRTAIYPEGIEAIREELDKLHQYPEITVDIEAFSLKHYNAGIGTIGFAWNRHEGICFTCDYEPCEMYRGEYWCHKDKKYKKADMYGKQVVNLKVYALLKEFFTNYKGKLIYHNGSYDVKVLIYVLWMKHITDQVGLLEGLEVMTPFDDTKVVSYLATNNCAGNKLGLKEQAFEYLGDYAEDVKDIRIVPLPALLEYNLKDCLGTWFVWDKNYSIMVQDEQEELYQGLMKDSLRNLLHVGLSGMPIRMDRVLEVEQILKEKSDAHIKAIRQFPMVEETARNLTLAKSEADFAKRKAKSAKPDKIAYIERLVVFNPGSGQQVAELLYRTLGLPVLDFTKSKQPATGAKEIEKLIHHTDNPEYKELIQHLIDLGKLTKVLTSFIPAFKTAQDGGNGLYYLFGNLNIASVVSGRLSSNNPNMQNIPSGSTFGKLIKSCFGGNDEWLFCSADFPALEERANTLLTRDPNKEAVYVSGFDGHCFRAVRYWPQEFPNIDPNDPVAVNAIENDPIGKKWRKESKSPTFALQFLGTYITLMKNCGFTEQQAKSIEANYRNMYKASVDWVEDRLEQAAIDGYATVAFGLRVRCPVMHATGWTRDGKVSKESAAEARTLGNALSGQSYGLLNNRAMNEFMERVYVSPYKYDIIPCNLIHDACYFLVRNCLGAVKFFNDNLPECMGWCELPELKHPKIGFPVMADIHYPTWSDEIRMPKQGTIQELYITFSSVA